MLNKIVAITMGDAAGIGPEITLKSLASEEMVGQPVIIVGCLATFRKEQALPGLSDFDLVSIKHPDEANFRPGVIHIIDEPLKQPDQLVMGKIQPQAGDCAYRCIQKATVLAMEGAVQAIATAPLNKAALHAGGHQYPGHTELLAELTSTEDFAMVLYTDKLRVIHVSTHIALSRFLQTMNADRLRKVIQIAHDFLIRIGYENPRIAVAGVNPHAGESGLFGSEEIKIINPVVREMQDTGFDVTGACPPDTVFLQAVEGAYDMVVAQYHDQGHIPLKLLGFHDGVNITAGLPFIRTSADHGTAFDIAGKGIAKPNSMMEALRLALKLPL